VWLVYTDFKSALTQVPNAVRILPVDPRAFEGGEGIPPSSCSSPSPRSMLDRLIPRYVEHQVFAGLLESAARARQPPARDEGRDRQRRRHPRRPHREANQARQAAITTEISEIVGGAEALSK
jgi:F-type H+-transporting ATPase subunit gamma